MCDWETGQLVRLFSPRFAQRWTMCDCTMGGHEDYAITMLLHHAEYI